MAYSKTEKTIWELAEPIAHKEGCYVYDLEYVKEGGIWFLRVYLDREGGISLDECEAVSRLLSDALDVADPISQQYYLEVSSPGVERKLKAPEHFAKYTGELIDVGLYRAINGNKRITGVLKGFADGVISLEFDGEVLEIPQKDTTIVNLHFEF